jgi:hypothetical protein
MKRLEQYMPIAIDVMEDIFLQETGKVDDKLDNLVSRFGVAVRQMGMETAVVAFSEKAKGQPNNDNKKEGLKFSVTKAVLRIIKLHEGKVCTENDTLLDCVKSNKSDKLLKSKIMDASVALKLASRLFIETGDERKEDENE